MFLAKTISRLRKLLCKLRRDERRAACTSDGSLTSIVVDADRARPQTAEHTQPPPPAPSVNEDPEPQLAEDVQRNLSLLPPSCSELQPEYIEILGDLPARAGAFANVWDGFLRVTKTRVVIKSYRVYSTTDNTQARIVRFRWYL